MLALSASDLIMGEEPLVIGYWLEAKGARLSYHISGQSNYPCQPHSDHFPEVWDNLGKSKYTATQELPSEHNFLQFSEVLRLWRLWHQSFLLKGFFCQLLLYKRPGL